MRLVTFTESSNTRIGLWDVKSHTVVDISVVAPDLPQDMLSLITQGDDALSMLMGIVNSDKGRLALTDITLLAPIPQPPRNILCVGKNYSEHVKEVQSVVASVEDTKGSAPAQPIIFTKAPSSVTGPGTSIPAWLDYTASTDYEGELAVIIGKGGRGIAREYAMEHIYGYSILNDVTSRRLQKLHQQWFLGKSLDGFCPMGPCLVTRDDIPDVTALRVQTYVNGDLRQDGFVREMIFDIPTLIETLSKAMTLVPGDIIATGTPAGVGMGFKPPRFLNKGDTVSITIEPIGILENTVE